MFGGATTGRLTDSEHSFEGPQRARTFPMLTGAVTHQNSAEDRRRDPPRRRLDDGLLKNLARRGLNERRAQHFSLSGGPGDTQFAVVRERRAGRRESRQQQG